ncbi:toxic anion resistance protein [Marinicella rhabdoformis]|uniref:toxic anion resistance protein n=1 Tax=Marinicella rhabdoformis TaxID=2580566 RepID=UPI0012AEC8AD|nr:toxic anion resistance protein [Marinicella rhabdoformis]
MEDSASEKEFGLIKLDHQRFKDSLQNQLETLSQQWLTQALAVSNDAQVKQVKQSLLALGDSEQQAFWQVNNRLKPPLEQLMRSTQAGGQATELLKQLHITVLKIKPPKNSFWGNFLSMFKLLFSVKESAWEMWLESFPVHQQKITQLTEQLAQHKKQLANDNAMLLGEKSTLNAHLLHLEHVVDVATHLTTVVEQETDKQSNESIWHDEWLPAIQKRTLELQQQLLIARQSVMSLDLFITQNEYQIRGIDQSVNTTTAAMKVTASIYVLEQAGQAASATTAVNKKQINHADGLIAEALSKMESVQTELESGQVQSE